MNEEIEKITKFMTIKRDVIEETINDERSTKFAVFLIAISIALGLIQSILQSFLAPDVMEVILGLFGFPTPSYVRIIMDAIASNIIFPILVIVLTFYIGNALKGEAESLNHVVRAIGYSVPPLIISSALSFLSLIPYVGIFLSFLNFVFGLWFVIIVIVALMITFKKGALTGIGSVILSAIIAGIAMAWTFIIP